MLWLADQVTVRGLGDGLLVILAADLLAMLPGSLTTAVQFVRQGLPMGEILPGLVAAPVQVLLVVLLRRARRHAVDDVGRPGRGALGGLGPIAPVCAYALVPSTSAGLDDRPGASLLAFGQPLHLALVAFALVGACLAGMARRSAPSVPALDGDAADGPTPGSAGAAQDAAVPTRLALFGALGIAVACCLPEALTMVTGPTLLLMPTGVGLFVVSWTCLDLLDAGAERREGT